MEVLLRQKLLASLSFPQVRVSDGEWHHLLVELRSIKDGKDIKYMAGVSLDYDMYQVWTKLQLHFMCRTFVLKPSNRSFQKSVEIGNDLPGLKLQTLHVGGLPGDKNRVKRGFVGCIQVIFPPRF